MAGVGSGKTYVGILKMLKLLDEYPGSRGVIVRQRFQQLKKTTAATLWKLLPRQFIARRNENDGMLKLTNGSELLLIHLDKTESLSNLKSMELNFAYVDQMEDISAEAWDTLVERVGRWTGSVKRGGWPANWPYKDRMGNCIPPRYVFASAYSPGFDSWITSRWWEHGTERDRYAKAGYKVVTGSTRDNLAVSQDYLDGRLAMGSEYVRRYVDAVEWGATEGRVFNLHTSSIIDPTPELLMRIKRSMKLHRVYDHGEFSPAACLWYATDEKGYVYFYREYMAADKLVSEHREAIYQMSEPDGWGTEFPRYSTNYADPIIFAKTRGRSATAGPQWRVADEWTDTRILDPKTAVYWRPAVNDEDATLNRVKEYLRFNPIVWNPITKAKGGTHVFFIRRTEEYPNGCHDVLADIRNARRVELPGTGPNGEKLYGDDRDDKVRDHLLDCVRYALIMRPSRAAQPDKPAAPPGHLRLHDYMEQTQNRDWLAEQATKAEPARTSGYDPKW